MNGDNRLISVLFVANLWKKLLWFELYVREMCTGLWIGSVLCWGLWPAGTPCRRRGRKFKGFFCTPGLIFGHVDGQRTVRI